VPPDVERVKDNLLNHGRTLRGPTGRKNPLGAFDRIFERTTPIRVGGAGLNSSHAGPT